MPKAKSKDEFIEQLFKEKPNLSMTGNYNGMSNSTNFMCKICGYEWNTKPKNLVYGRSVVGCPECARQMLIKEKLKKHNEFILQLKEINDQIEVIGEYTGSKNYIEVKCSVCGNVWKTRPDVLLSGSGCPDCGLKIRSENAMLTHDEFLERCSKTLADVTILGRYNGQKERILVQCNKCKTIYYTHVNSLLAGHGCSMCSGSNGEKRIRIFLDNCSIRYIPQYKFDKCKYKYRLPFDFYLPDYNICIEYDGRQHFEPIDFFGGEEEFISRKIRDGIKTQFCNENDIGLIRIPYYNFDNIEDILLSKFLFI